MAAQQTAGRGRQGRSWISPPGEGLYLSVILRPEVPPAAAPVITLGAAVAVAETLWNDFEVTADIKWPNDVLAGGLKISGVLVEAATEADRLEYAITGIGVNLNQREFPAGLREIATSVFLQSGRTVQPRKFAIALLTSFEEVYRQALVSPARTIARWEARSTYARGRTVRITSGASNVDGITRGLTERGALLLELDTGEVREIISGEVSLRPAGS
jgi:BirA family biotin operon repressor/biotin-[acetyl-CoA-carboxylase] ligase